MADDAAARIAVVGATRRLEQLGLNHGTAGNVGLRVPGGVLVTPSGMPPAALHAADIVRLDDDGTPAPNQRIPTSEWRLHVDLFAARADVVAVVHTHSPEATAVSCRRAPLPAVHYSLARAGTAAVPCAEYATYGTAELSANVVAAIGPSGACLLANHGLVAVAGSLDDAVELALEVEWVAKVWRLAGGGGAPVHLLDDAEMARVAELFRVYGQPPERGS